MSSSKSFNTPGIGGDIQFGMLFAAWAKELKSGVTIGRIIDRFQCSRATAYRWLKSWELVKGSYE